MPTVLKTIAPKGCVSHLLTGAKTVAQPHLGHHFLGSHMPGKLGSIHQIKGAWEMGGWW